MAIANIESTDKTSQVITWTDPVPISGTVATTGGLTDAQLRAADVKISLDGETVPLAPGTYLGQQVIAGNDGNQNATIPLGTKAIWVMAEGGAVGCTVNGTSASIAAAGYHVPENNVRLIGPFSNITSLGVFAATGDNAHLIYES